MIIKYPFVQSKRTSQKHLIFHATELTRVRFCISNQFWFSFGLHYKSCQNFAFTYRYRILDGDKSACEMVINKLQIRKIACRSTAAYYLLFSYKVYNAHSISSVKATHYYILSRNFSEFHYSSSWSTVCQTS